MIFFQDVFPIFHDLMRLSHLLLWKHLLWFLLIGFIVVFLVFYPTGRIYIWYKISTFHGCFQSNLIFRKKWWKKFIYNIIYFIINHDSLLLLFQCMTHTHTHSTLLPLEEIKLIAIVNWIFHASDCLRFFVVSFKCGLILSR